MNYDWNNYLSLGEKLYNDPPQNADDQTLSRNIFSRVYYAAHNIARIKKFEFDGIDLSEDRDKHFKVIAFFTNYDNDHDTGISDPLDSLRKKRGEADYHEEITFNLPEAQLALFNAEEIIEEINKI